MKTTNIFNLFPTLRITLFALSLGFWTFNSYAQSLTVTCAHQNVSCNGNNDGHACVTPNGGITPYTYLWFPTGHTGMCITGIIAGTYTVVVADNAGSTAACTNTISEPSALICSITTTGGNDATVNVAGGTAPYTYLWSNGQITQTVTGLIAGTYTVTVADASGCTCTSVVTISTGGTLSVTCTHTNVMCNGGCDGSAHATPSGGTLPYTYQWNSGQITQTATGLCAGNYHVIVTDATGATAICASTITQPPAMTTTVASAPATCGQCNGHAIVNVSGGTPPYVYIWSNLQTTQIATGLCAGVYTVVVTDATGATCGGTQSVTVTNVNGPVVTVSGTTSICAGMTATLCASGATSYLWNPGGETTACITVAPSATSIYTVIGSCGAGTGTAVVTVFVSSCPCSVVITSTNILCNGQCNGTATANPSGGTAPYSYIWNPMGQTTQTATGLCAGIYTVTVTDATGCTSTKHVIITEPTLFSCTVTVTGNFATVYAGGGTSPYTYNWLPGGQTTATATGLSAGTYTIAITDANGCSSICAITISNIPCNVNLHLKKDSINPLLWYAYPFVTGTAPFSYFWDFGDGNTSTQPHPTHTYAVIGNYKICLTITDANGCISTSCDTTYKIVSPNSIQTVVVVNTTGIEENTVSVTSVFPNPSSDRIEILFSEFVKGKIQITDITGREVYNEKINANNVSVNISSLPIGFYNLIVVSGSKTMHEKIMIAR